MKLEHAKEMRTEVPCRRSPRQSFEQAHGALQKAFEEPLSEDEVEEVQPIQTANPGEVTMGLKDVELD